MRRLLTVLCALLICTALLASLFNWQKDFVTIVQDGFGTLQKVSDFASSTYMSITEFLDWFRPIPQDELAETLTGSTDFVDTMRYLFVEHKAETSAYLAANYANTKTPKHNGHYVFCVLASNKITYYAMLDQDWTLMRVYHGAPHSMLGSYNSQMEEDTSFSTLLWMWAFPWSYEKLDIDSIRGVIQNA